MKQCCVSFWIKLTQFPAADNDKVSSYEQLTSRKLQQIYILLTTPISSIIKKHSLVNHQLYADDTQVYLGIS